jgi:ADP-dependent phosphofructokinase/glucokinase
MVDANLSVVNVEVIEDLVSLAEEFDELRKGFDAAIIGSSLSALYEKKLIKYDMAL